MMASAILNKSILRLSILRSSRLNPIRLGHGPNMPPFARLRPPAFKLNEETELVWDDSVAPETCVDFDAQHVTSEKVFKSFFMAFGAIFLLYGIVSYSNPSHRNPVAPRSSVISHSNFKAHMGVAGESDSEEFDE